VRLAVAVGFEPTEACTSHAFEACSFGRSDTLPPRSLQDGRDGVAGGGASQLVIDARACSRQTAPVAVTFRSACLVAVTLLLTVACAPAPQAPAPKAGSACPPGGLPTLKAGLLTFGTDQPVYPPWYMADNPASGEGFEAAVAYAVAAKMNYEREDVRWVRVPFNAALAPGPKPFDANLSEFSITEQRKAAVDFSSPYFAVTQAVVTVKSSPAASVKTVNQLRTLRLGAQVGTTSYTAATSVHGDVPVEVYNTNGDAKMALRNGEIDAVVADLPTAFAITNELGNGMMVGQLPNATGDVDQLGVVLDKGSALTPCVSWAVETLRGDGTLGKLEQQWLADAGRAPVLT
jgi:polar amino acid transport system substrate-binding protein